MMKFVNWLWLISISQLCAQTPTTFTNAIGMKFVLIQPGQMTVGRFQPTYPTADEARKIGWSAEEYAEMERQVQRDTRPGFPVRIRQSYYMGQFEVTQAQWKRVMGRNPSVFQGNKVTDNPDEHPVENVTWADAQAFVEKLNAFDKGRTYRLPTELEWEYAARAGATDDIAWVDIRQQAQMGLRTTARVGQKKPNAWGLYDTLGNVWEWVQDAYDEQPFAKPGPKWTDDEHVLKGASFVGDVKNATYLTHAAGPGNGWDVGFRVLVEVNHKLKIPVGFTPLFNGKDLKGWHKSRTTHQGTTGNFSVEDGAITLQQNPYGQGGVLLTDRKYRNFELYLEAKIDSLCNGGIFLRSTESGQGYQVELVMPGGLGNLLGEMLPISQSARATDIARVWKPGDWNSFRIRMEGAVPHLTLWVNGVQLWDVVQPKNDFIAGATEGMIGLQLHWSAVYSPAAKAFSMAGSWRPNGTHRFRNVAIKELK